MVLFYEEAICAKFKCFDQMDDVWDVLDDHYRLLSMAALHFIEKFSKLADLSALKISGICW